MSLVHGHCDPRFERLRAQFEESFADGGEIGAGVSVYLDGEPVVDLWGGFADAERTRPWQRDTIVSTASTTKGFTATCAHRLVDEGRLDLDAPFAKYWPEFAQAGKQEIPVRWLLSHRAGLPAIRQELDAEAVLDWNRMVECLAEESPWWEPGTKFGYHALTFGFLVGEVIRRIAGRSVGRYLREEITGPLGVDFHIGVLEKDDGRVAEMIRIAETEETSAVMQRIMKGGDSLIGRAFGNPALRESAIDPKRYRRAEIPAANGHGTAEAVARLYGALSLGGELDGVRVLSREAIDRATTEQSFGEDAVLGIPMRFGLGYMLRHDGLPLGPNDGTFGHLGMGGSIGFADPTARLGFGYVMNKMQGAVAGAARGFKLILETYACV